MLNKSLTEHGNIFCDGEKRLRITLDLSNMAATQTHLTIYCCISDFWLDITSNSSVQSDPCIAFNPRHNLFFKFYFFLQAFPRK